MIRRTAGRRLLRHRGVSCRVRRLSTGLVAVVRVRPSVSLNWSSSSAPSTDACVSVAVSRSTSTHCCSDQCAQLAVVGGQYTVVSGRSTSAHCGIDQCAQLAVVSGQYTVVSGRSTSAHCCSDQCAQLAAVSGQWEIDLGYVGCQRDVLGIVDRRCSGLRVCEIRIPDAELEGTRACIKELKTYLHVAYRCVTRQLHPSCERTMRSSIELF